MQILLYAVAVLLLLAVALFVKVAIFSKRPQKIGLIYAVLAVPLFVIYYADRIPFWPAPLKADGTPNLADHPAREWALLWLNRFQGANIGFVSDFAPAAIVAGLVLVQMTVFQRVAVRRRLQRIHDPIANFFAGAMTATMIGGILVSTFAWGWPGALIVAGVFALVYLGALALLAAVLEIFLEVAKLIAAWLKRKVFTIATWITRIASFISSLAGRLGLTSLVDRIRQETAEQESIFANEQEEQDRKLEDAYVRDRARRRAAARRRGKTLRGDEQPPAPAAPAPAPPQPVAPAAEGAEPPQPA
jgi:hypothetical protein